MQCVFVHGGTVKSLPAFLADATAFNTESVSRASWMDAVDFLAELALVPSDAGAFPVDAVTVSVAVGDFALIVA